MKILLIIITLLLLGLAGFIIINQTLKPAITDFDSCVAAGNPVMESYPPQCAAKGQTYTQYIGNILEKQDLIRIDYPRPNDTITSPLTITGLARGTWFFEASFPIKLVNSQGNVIAQTLATAEGEWMTEEFVPFNAVLEFTPSGLDELAALILEKDNPSDKRELDDQLEIPVRY